MAEFDIGQVLGDHVHAAGITHHDNAVCNFFGTEVDVEHGPIIVYNQFGFRNSHIYFAINY